MLGDVGGHARIGIAGEKHEIGVVRLHVGPSCYKGMWLKFLSKQKTHGDNTLQRGLAVSAACLTCFQKHTDPLIHITRVCQESCGPAPGGTATPGLRPTARNLAGVEGFEPANAGIKIRCLNQLGDTPTQDSCCCQQQTYKLFI